MALDSDILDYLERLLEPSRFEDHCPNGLQVPGRTNVEHVITGVSASLELFQRARSAGADLILVHHGLFWEGQSRALTRSAAERLRLLLDAEVGLAAYHLPLDAHPDVGNNALIVEGLGCVGREPFGLHRGRPIGFSGDFPGEGIASTELFARVDALTGRAALVFDGGPARVRRVGVVSGGGARNLDDAVAAGLDAFLTGEPSEPAMALAREASVHFIAAGHYATETFGVRALGERVADHFGVGHEFIDLPNPV
ncbi:MAG: Nif3-like dinuclear metal center hexameric protein [Actinomycetota bacterium]|nr:Nif3-like dinuclear metal center hexameric protein [Actinomycetota bacterium]